MGRRKQTAPAAPPEPEDESQEPPEDEGDQEEEPEAQPSGRPGGKVKKADAVRAALAEGFDGPEEGVGFIRDRFGIEMKREHFSSVKSQLKKREAEGREAPAPKAQREPRAQKADPAEGYLAPPPQQASGQPDLLAAMEAMKPLVASLGKDQVKRIVELLG